MKKDILKIEGIELTRAEIIHRTVEDYRFIRVKISDTKFEDVDFEHIELEDCSFERCSFINCRCSVHRTPFARIEYLPIFPY